MNDTLRPFHPDVASVGATSSSRCFLERRDGRYWRAGGHRRGLAQTSLRTVVGRPSIRPFPTRVADLSDPDESAVRLTT